MIAREIWHRSSNDLHTFRYVTRKGVPKRRRGRSARRKKLLLSRARTKTKREREINGETDYEIERKRKKRKYRGKGKKRDSHVEYCACSLFSHIIWHLPLCTTARVLPQASFPPRFSSFRPVLPAPSITHLRSLYRILSHCTNYPRYHTCVARLRVVGLSCSTMNKEIYSQTEKERQK